MMFLPRALPCSLLLLVMVSFARCEAQADPLLAAYAGCTFEDGLAVSELSQLPAGVKGRTVLTMEGSKPVTLSGGEHISLRYPGTGLFATVKVEVMPAETFEQGKKDLIGNFDYILAGGDDSTRNMAYALRPRLNGFEVYGLDRKRLEGNTLGIYLLFDNRTHMVASVYFLNQEAGQRKFATQAQWVALRDQFLYAYTACVHAPHEVAAPVKTAAKTPVKKKGR